MIGRYALAIFLHIFADLTVDDSDVGEGRRRVEEIKMINLENETESLRAGRRRRTNINSISIYSQFEESEATKVAK